VGTFCPLSPPEEANLDDRRGEGGLGGQSVPTRERSEPTDQIDSAAPPKPKKPRCGNKSAGKPQPEGEKLDETWC
jgi:hypothetical protein